MSDLHIELVECVMRMVESRLEKPMDIVEEYELCAEALERNNFDPRDAACDVLGIKFW